MFDTTPLRRPRHGTLPTPSTVMPSESTSPTTADTLVVPMSRPTTISELSKRPFILPTSSFRSTLPWWSRNGQVSVGFSSHPHHDPLGVRLVVQEDDRRLRV